LRDVRIPKFEYSILNGVLTYRWIEVIQNFTMPIEINVDGENIKLYPTTQKKSIKIESEAIKVNKNYYVNSVKV
jgi:hypothetical protein